MFRSCAALLVLGSWTSALLAQEPAGERKFSAPLNVAAERSKIIGEFITAQSKKVPFLEALAARDAALGQLAEVAEEAKSADPALLHIYLMLNRHEDLLRAAAPLLERNPNDLNVRAYQLQSLISLKRTDEAAAAYGKLMALDIAAADARTYVSVVPTAAQGMIRFLAEERKFTEAEEALAAWVVQLDQLKAGLEQAPGAPQGSSSLLTGTYGNISSLKRDIGQKKQLARILPDPLRPAGTPMPTGAPGSPMPSGLDARALARQRSSPTTPASVPSTQPSPPSAEPLKAATAPPTTASSSTPTARDITTQRAAAMAGALPGQNRLAMPTGPRKFAEPLNVGGERSKIDVEFSDSRFQGQSEGPEYERFRAARKDALSQLAAAAEAAKSSDHIVLMRLYADLERYDDAVREARAIVQTDAANHVALAYLLKSLIVANRPDDALATFQEWLAVDVPLADVEAYLKPLKSGYPSTVRSLAIVLCEAGRPDDALQALNAMQAKLEQLLAKYDQGPVPAGLQRPTISNEVSTVSLLRMDAKNGRLGSVLRKELDTILAATNLGRYPEGSPEFDKLLTARIEGLVKLATTAETAKSTDDVGLSALYRELTAAYRQAKRPDEALVRFKELITLNPAAWVARREHFTLLCELKRLDDALVAFRDWVAQDVPWDNSHRYLQQLVYAKSPVDPLIPLLNETGRYADALSALEPLNAKLAGFVAAYDKGPVPPGVTDETRAYLATARSVAFGFGNAVVDAEWTKLGNASSRPAVARSVLENELNKISKEFDFAKFPQGTPRQGPDFEKFMAGRKEALTKLAASPIAAQSTDHVALARLYSSLQRHDDAANAAQAYAKLNPTSAKAYSLLLLHLCNAKRMDDALAACRQWLALDVPLRDVEAYLEPLESGPIKKLLIRLRVMDKYEEADQLLNETQAKVDQLLASYDKGPAPLKLKRTTISNAIVTLSSLRNLDSDVEHASRSDLRIQLDDIFVKYSLSAGRGQGVRTGPEAEKLMADRAAAFAALAAAPETAESTDLPTLVKLYALLDHTDEALAAFQRWMAQDVTLANVKKFLPHVGGLGEVHDLIQALVRAGRLSEGWQATIAVEEKLDRLLALYDKGPAPRYVSRQEINMAISHVWSTQGDLVTAEQQAYAAATGPVALAFSNPLRLSTESRRINNVFVAAKDQRLAALRQLAAAAEAANTTQHVALASVYAVLERYADAEREIRTALNQNAADVRAHDALIQLLCRLQRTEEAVAAFRKLISLEVSKSANDALTDVASKLALELAEAGEFDAALGVFSDLIGLEKDVGYTDSVARSGLSLAKLLAGAGNFAEADRVFDAWQSSIDRRAEKLRDPQGNLPPIVADFHQHVANQRLALKKPELVGKPYMPITDTIWLNGPALRPEDLQGKALLIYWPTGLESRFWTDLRKLNDWGKEFGDQGLVVVGVLRRQGLDFDPVSKQTQSVAGLAPARQDAAAKAVLTELEVTCRIVMDADNALVKQYQVKTLPSAVLVDRRGVVRTILSSSGSDNKRALEAGIRQTLGPAK